MKRAFDENVSKSKPKLRLGRALAGVTEAEPGEAVALQPPPPRVPPQQDVDDAHEPHAIAERVAAEAVPVAELPHAGPTEPVALAAPTPEPVIPVAHAASPHVLDAPPTPRAKAPRIEARAAEPKRAPIAVVAPPVARAEPTTAERREKLKERLKKASAPVSVRDPAPASAAEAEASSLSMIGLLQQALERSEAENVALSKDLETVRAQLSRAAAEARDRTDEAQSLAGEARSRTELLEELTGELAALEAERDDALSQLSGARADADAQRQRGAALDAQLQAKEKELLEAIAEEEHIAADLDARTDEVRTLRGLAASLTTERDSLLQNVSALTREREELSDARKALESVHRALADARTRVQPARR